MFFDRFVNFVDFRSFSKNYNLKGKDEDQVRQLFTPNVIHYFEENQLEFDIEAEDHNIVFYTNRRRRVQPSDVRTFLEKCNRAIQVLKL